MHPDPLRYVARHTNTEIIQTFVYRTAYVLWSYGRRAATVPCVPARAPTNVQLGKGVRRLRLARRLTIETLAGEARMHPTYLSAIERGLRNPTWTKLCQLAEALDITISTLARIAEAEAYGAVYTPEDGDALNTAPTAAPTSPWRR
jgi:transcriptional regulator with XRE-family HTH domain